jgi:hypothetical protein
VNESKVMMNDKQRDVQVNISLDELKALIQEAVHDALQDLLGEDLNPEPNFAPHIAERLKRYKTEKPIHFPIDSIANE